MNCRRRFEEQDEEEMAMVICEDDEPGDLYIEETVPTCGICELDHLTSDCPVIASNIHIEDNELPKALSTIPVQITYEKLANGKYKLLAKEKILKGTKFGPLIAQRSQTEITAVDHPRDCEFLSLKLFNGKEFDCYLDTTDQTVCNWMTLVKYSEEKHNLICYQLDQDIYFTAKDDIGINEELVIGYSKGYGTLMGICKPGNVYQGNIKTKTAETELLSIKAQGQEKISTISQEPVLSSNSVMATSQAIAATKVQETNLILDDIPWICKFCSEQFQDIISFANHLITHYKQLGAARTELRKQNRKGKVTRKMNEQQLSRAEEIKPKAPYFCDICTTPKGFNLGEYTIRHLVKHCTGVTCLDCNQIFPSQNDLSIHQCFNEIESDLDSKPIIPPKCKLCPDMGFKTFKKLSQHLKSKHILESHECCTCNGHFNSSSEAEYHICPKRANFTTNHQNIVSFFMCGLCENYYSDKVEIVTHIIQVHCLPFKCSICDKILTASIIRTHFSICEMVHKFSNRIVSELHCPICTSAGFVAIEDFRNHVEVHTNPYKCAKCHLRLKSKLYLKNHKCCIFYCDEFICAEEGKRFNTRTQLISHLKDGHGLNNTDYYCYECCLPFVTKERLASHETCKDMNLVSTNKELPSSDKPSTQVEQQRKESSNSKHSKNRRKPFQYRNRNKSNSYICEKCGAIYSSWNSMKTHRYTHAVKKYICKTCGKKFHRKDLLLTHEFVHVEPTFSCDECNKKFKTVKSLAIHQKIHTGVKRFSCAQCGMAFSQKINLQTHSAIHIPLEERGFQCTICFKHFSNVEYLNFHVESRHADIAAAMDESKKSNNSRRLKYSCPVCNKIFFKAFAAKEHYKNAHGSGSRKFSCEFCDLVVKYSQSFRRHLRRMHNDQKLIWSVQGYQNTRCTISNEQEQEVIEVINNTEDNDTLAEIQEEHEDEDLTVITINNIDVGEENVENIHHHPMPICEEILTEATQDSLLEDTTEQYQQITIVTLDNDTDLLLDESQEQQLELQLGEFILPSDDNPYVLILETDPEGRGILRLAQLENSIEQLQEIELNG